MEVIERVSLDEMSRCKDRRGSVILAKSSLCLRRDQSTGRSTRRTLRAGTYRVSPRKTANETGGNYVTVSLSRAAADLSRHRSAGTTT